MSDSDSKDSDEGIRYKTESVRNKTKINDNPRKINRNSYHEDKTRDRSRKGYSRSMSPKKSRYKIISNDQRKRQNERSSGRKSSTSSSDDKNKSKSVKKKCKKEDINYCPKMRQNMQRGDRTKPSLINDEKEVIQKEIIGPALPPHLQHKKNDSGSKLSLQAVMKKNDEDSYIGHNLPAHLEKAIYNKSLQQSQSKMEDTFSGPQPTLVPIGPELPISVDPCLLPNLREDVVLKDQQISHSPEVSSYIGPQLPVNLPNSDDHKNNKSERGQESKPQIILLSPSLKQSHEDEAIKTIGPSLPPHLRKKFKKETEEHGLVKGLEEEEEEDIYGPLPVGMSSYSLSHKALEERALQLKIDQLEPKGSNEPVRESWMIELPTAKAANFGLGPRQFRNRSGPDLSDRSSWTDLPGDKNKKKTGDVAVDLKAEAELKELRKRDKEQEMLTKRHKRKKKSLLKLHKEKLEKDKQGVGPSERKPFSRDVDLQVNKFDDAQKNAIMKKAQLLDNRFSSGKSKYL